MEYLWYWNQQIGMYDIFQRVEGELYEIWHVARVKREPMNWILDHENTLV